MKRTLLAAAALLLPMASFAVGWGQVVNITGYYVWDGGLAYIRTTNHQNPDSCQSSQYLALDSTQSNFKAIWAQIISANAQGQTVQLFYDGCIASGNQNWPKIRAIAVPGIW